MAILATMAMLLRMHMRAVRDSTDGSERQSISNYIHSREGSVRLTSCHFRSGSVGGLDMTVCVGHLRGGRESGQGQ